MLVIQDKEDILNIDLVRSDIKKMQNKKIIITVYGLRNRCNKFEGIINKIYPNIFTVLVNSEEKSFCYRDIITGDVKIKMI